MADHPSLMYILVESSAMADRLSFPLVSIARLAAAQAAVEDEK